MESKLLFKFINYKSGKLITAEKKLLELMKRFPNNYFLYNLLRKESIIAAKKYLFNNRKTLIEFEKFLIESHQAAQHGKKLKDGSIFKTK